MSDNISEALANGLKKVFNQEEIYVDYENIKNRYEVQFQAAYEKANIWPIDNAKMGLNILEEEIYEVEEDAQILEKMWNNGNDSNTIPTKKELGNLRGMAVSTILECLQVISVVDKYEDVFARPQPQASEDKTNE